MKRTFVLPGLKTNLGVKLVYVQQEKRFFYFFFFLGKISHTWVCDTGGFLKEETFLCVYAKFHVSHIFLCGNSLFVGRVPRASPRREWDIYNHNTILPPPPFEDSITKGMAIFQLICAGAAQPEAKDSFGPALLQPQPVLLVRCAVLCSWSSHCTTSL